MGKIDIRQNFKGIFVSAPRADFIVFVEQLRELLRHDVERFISEQTDFSREQYERAVADKAHWEKDGRRIYTIEQLEAEVNKQRDRLQRDTSLAEGMAQTQATLEFSKGRTLDIRGTAKEIFGHPDAHRAKKITVNISGAPIDKSIRLYLEPLNGLSAYMVSDDETWFHAASTKLVQERKRLRPSWAWLRAGWSEPTYAALSVILFMALLMVSGMQQLPASFLGTIAGLVFFFSLKAIALPSFVFSDLPRPGNAILKWIGGVIGALVIAVIGGFLTKVFFP